MMPTLRHVLVAAVAALVIGCSRPPEVLTESGLLILEGATIVDPALEAPLKKSVVIVRGERIVRVGRVGDFRYPSDATITNVSGRYLMPGFIDVHVHVPMGAEIETLRMLLAFGITTIMSPGSSPEQGTHLRQRVAAGEIHGPRMFVAGRALTSRLDLEPWGVQVTTEEEMQAEIRRQAASGVDWIKLYRQLSPELVKVAVSAAHTHGLKVVGHMGVTSWTEAASAGIDGLTHSGHAGPTWELVEPEHREQLRSIPLNVAPPEQLRVMSMAQRYTKFLEVIDLGGKWFTDLVATLVDHDVTVDPTLVNINAMVYGDDLRVLATLEPALAPPRVTATWGDGWAERHTLLRQFPEWDMPAARGLFPIALAMVRRFHDAGVRIATGTDVGMPWITPGVSLHRELEFLVSAGIPTRDALLAATRNGAEYLGVLSDVGTIAPGKTADFVLLRSNPLQDIRNTRSIEAVYRAGRRHLPGDLLPQSRGKVRASGITSR